MGARSYSTTGAVGVKLLRGVCERTSLVKNLPSHSGQQVAGRPGDWRRSHQQTVGSTPWLDVACRSVAYRLPPVARLTITRSAATGDLHAPRATSSSLNLAIRISLAPWRSRS